MPAARPFRFATGAAMTTSAAAYVARARQTEALGYSTFRSSDEKGIRRSFRPLP